jgi:Ni/Co efflux regulator RcnB
MKSRTLAIAGSIAALTFVAGPLTAVATAKAHQRPVAELRLDRSRDVKGAPHVDKSVDKSRDRGDNTRDLRDF